MAQRRMISLKITDTDMFLDMPLTARYLYLEFCTRADDDGFISSPKKILRMVGCSDDDFKILMAKQFIFPFESGVCVIKHWKIHNYIRSDRYTETIYLDEKSALDIDENNSYIRLEQKESTQNVIPNVIPSVIPAGYTGKDRLGKDKLEIKKYIVQQVDTVWARYPLKKGKATAIKKIPKLIEQYGYEQLIRCIERYELGLQKEMWRKPQNGSTFFNSGYVDYLDENYHEGVNDNGGNSKTHTTESNDPYSGLGLTMQDLQ
ncbi:hypothetical protein [Niameybacter massiliensis]|uniref:hypothetical protein n=1 Tax=Niameybacter massiliensis TaxID=1658108 RepID=UPI0006B672E2|nr:hypothetical protein [Niameybacter massiliensis]